MRKSMFAASALAAVFALSGVAFAHNEEHPAPEAVADEAAPAAEAADEVAAPAEDASEAIEEASADE